jgi:uncharacterized protein YecE (DUF72 family)
MHLPLFDPPSTFNRTALANKLSALAASSIYIGTSSWKYEGWLDQIYTRENYLYRGRFSEKRFQSECLAEYAQTFPIVCADFTFYQFPTEPMWRRLFTPPNLKYALKVPEEITVKAFPSHPRYGPRAGDPNHSFLDAALFRTAFLDVLRPWRDRIAVLIFEFGTFPKYCYRDASEFLAELDPFLASLDPDFRYAVEIRNQEFLHPDYFACLRRHHIAHVFNAWTRMPELSEQMQLPDVYTADFTVTRALLRRGRPYEDAVKTFTPYTKIQDVNEPVRAAIRDVIQYARDRAQPSYIFVNNRLEGNAPATIESLLV